MTQPAPQLIQDQFDRFLASDPGYNRLRLGFRVVVAVATTAALQFLVAQALGLESRLVALHVMLGAVVSMNSASAIRDPSRRAILLTGLGAPWAAMLSTVLAVTTAATPVLNIPIFVALTFLAVFVRQFNPRYGTWGFIAWQAFFFCLYLHPPLSAVPGLWLTILISTTWVTLLLVTVFAEDPSARLRRTVVALRARARTVLSVALDVLEHPERQSERRNLHRAQAQFNEVALLFDALLANDRAVPDGVTAAELRRWVVEVEVSLDEVVGATVEIADRGDQVPAATRARVKEALQQIGWGQIEAARQTTAALAKHSTVRPVRRLAWSSGILLDAFDHWRTGHFDGAEAETFDPVVNLVAGNLPGSTAHAKAVAEATTSRWRGAGLSLTTRQALQAGTAAALAITFGRMLAPDRFYWAVIAAFVSFIGTATSDETVRKSVGRVFGTRAGLAAALGLAHWTSGHVYLTLLLLFACVFLAFYLQPVSVLGMIFFITLMLGQLYALLNEFSAALLLERLAETAIGGLSGIVAAMVVFPVSGRSTLATSRRALFSALAEVTRDCAAVLRDEGDPPDLYRRVVELDAAGRSVSFAADNLFAMPRLGPRDNTRQHRVAILASAVRTARALVPPLVELAPGSRAELAPALDLIADEADRLSGLESLGRDAKVDGPSLAERVRGVLDETPAEPAMLRRRIQRLADTLSLFGSPTRRS